jgi:sugar phosphate isomerase/epimerase
MPRLYQRFSRMPTIPQHRLSIGTFYNPHLAQFTLDHSDLIDHLAMADPPTQDDEFFPSIQQQFPLLLHDYLGQLSDPLSEFALQRARSLQERYRSPWVAEHFQCLHTQDHSRSLDYVFPPLYTEEFLQRFCQNALVLRDAVGAPLVMENIPGFFSVRRAQMTEAEFLRRFFEQTGCGFLIDIPHIWLAAHYRGIDPREYLAEFPLDRVVEIHVAGVEYDRDLEGPWIAPTAPNKDILQIACWVAERAPKLRAVTLDVFSPTVTAAQLEDSMRSTREAFAVASAAAS